jgi:hypothetical protein
MTAFEVKDITWGHELDWQPHRTKKKGLMYFGNAMMVHKQHTVG